MKQHGVQHTTSAIYHPASNGQAERFVLTFKNALKAMKSESRSLEAKVARFLITYRTSVNLSTGEIPSVLMLGRLLRTRLDLIKPTSKNYVPRANHSERLFEIGLYVLVRDYRPSSSKWIPGIIHEKIGSLMYGVKVSGNVIWKRHCDQIIDKVRPVSDPSYRQPVITPVTDPPRQTLQPVIMGRTSQPVTTAVPATAHATPQPVTGKDQSTTATTTPGSTSTTQSENTDPKTVITARGRKVVPPRRLGDFVPR